MSDFDESFNNDIDSLMDAVMGAGQIKFEYTICDSHVDIKYNKLYSDDLMKINRGLVLNAFTHLKFYSNGVVRAYLDKIQSMVIET
jgi:hypothetical protein